MPKRDNRTYQTALRAQAKIAAAQQALAEEPMHRYPHPIPMSSPCPEPDPDQTLQGQTLTRILEELQGQSQLLVDLTEAVKGLTAALLACQRPSAG